MKYYYKKSDGKVVELEQQNELYFRMGIIELVIPDGCEIVDCAYNQLKELIIPDGCVWVRADMKSVTELNKIDHLRLFI